MPNIQHKRGTSAGFSSLVSGDSLKIGQIYYITDNVELRVATGTNTYETFVQGIKWDTAVNSNIVPDTGNVYSFGSSSFQFDKGWFRNIDCSVGITTEDLTVTGDSVFSGEIDAISSNIINDSGTISTSTLNASSAVSVAGSGELQMASGSRVQGSLIPDGVGTQNLGSISSSWDNIYCGDTITAQDIYVFGTITFDNVGISSNVLPETTETYNIGSTSYRWLSGYFTNLDVSGTVDGRNIGVDGVVLDALKASIGAHNDVSIKTPVDGEVLMWSTNNGGEWTNAAISLYLEDLTDVNAPSPSNGQILQYDVLGGKWVKQNRWNGFAYVAVSGQSTIGADSYIDTLNVAEDYGIKLTTNTSTDTLTIKGEQLTYKCYGDYSPVQSVYNATVKVNWNSHTASSNAFNELGITESTGTRRTVPATGTYDIKATVRVDANNRCELIVQIYVNGSPITEDLESDYISRDTDQNTGSVTVDTTLQLSANDYIEVEATGDCDGTAANIITGTKLIIKRTK